MRAHGRTAVWETPVGARRASGSTRWYQRLWDWWAAHAARRQHARLAALNASWDAKRETLKSPRAEAASEMAAAHGALSTVTQIYGLTL